MPRSTGTTVENTFVKGLVTEATGLNFPENAATETYDCIFDQTGQVYRRLGLDVESSHEVAAFEESDGAIMEFVWRAVARSGEFTFLVMQMGTQVIFFEMSLTSISSGLKAFAVDLNTYATIGSTNIQNDLCAFASGNGNLYITHPQCDPILVNYDQESDSLVQSAIVIKTRDIEGIDDTLDIDEQPATLTSSHLYNLFNQGWYREVRMVTPGGGAGALTTEAGGIILLDPDAFL